MCTWAQYIAESNDVGSDNSLKSCMLELKRLAEPKDIGFESKSDSCHMVLTKPRDIELSPSVWPF
jgi:hypothetical protein